MKSPLTNTENTLFQKSIPSDFLIKEYKAQYGVDVKEFFQGVNEVIQYTCLDTGLVFFYPFSLAGNNRFYEDFEKFDWYYMENKWEHQMIEPEIKAGSKVLEIGCARGAFLETLGKKGIDCVGLELNENAAEIGNKKGLKILNQTIQEHALTNNNCYDLVCSFQVMEHVVDVKNIIQSSIDVLKKGGKLVISVPNNDSFLSWDLNIMNLPPHHMILWNENSLKSLTSIFNIELKKINLEPLQSYHKNYFKNTVRKYYRKNKMPLRALATRLIPMLLPFYSKSFKSFSIEVIFEKK